jgi:hypothetical protein
MRFAPIQVNIDGKQQPGVLSRAAVNLSIMASTRQRAERHSCQTNLDDLRGSRPLGHNSSSLIKTEAVMCIRFASHSQLPL